MENKLTKIFQKAKYETSETLAENIWLALVVRDRRIARFKLAVFSLVGLSSLAGLIPAFKMLSNDFVQSGFYEYFSLLFSDSRSIISYWKEFTFSLAEALPVVSIIFVLSLIFVFFLSLRYAMKQIGKNQLALSF